MRAYIDMLCILLFSQQSEGHVLHIPMLGHPVGAGQTEELKEAVEKLEGLIKQHDVVFLLTDSRESRSICIFQSTREYMSIFIFIIELFGMNPKIIVAV